MPTRIQLRRERGWRKPEGAIVVARPTRWGNPVRIADVAWHYPRLNNNERQVAQTAVNLFRQLAADGVLSLPNWAVGSGPRGPITWTYPSLDEIRAELAGHDLACWCPIDMPCHGSVLLELANGGAP